MKSTGADRAELKLMKNISGNPLKLESEIRPIKCLLIYPLSDRKIQKKYSVSVMRYRLTRFQGKG